MMVYAVRASEQAVASSLLTLNNRQTSFTCIHPNLVQPVDGFGEVVNETGCNGCSVHLIGNK